MPGLTLEAIAKTMQTILREELQPTNNRLAAIETTLEVHTRALDQLLTEKKTREQNKTVENGRLDQLERWAKQVSQKLGIEFRP